MNLHARIPGWVLLIIIVLAVMLVYQLVLFVAPYAMNDFIEQTSININSPLPCIFLTGEWQIDYYLPADANRLGCEMKVAAARGDVDFCDPNKNPKMREGAYHRCYALMERGVSE